MTRTNSSNPYFSIVIPAFNRETEIVRAVESCLNQSFQDIEVVVVDDASTDNTAAVVADIPDSRLRLIRHPVNRNVCPARNTGSANSRGEWVVFLDSDDVLAPGALQTMWKYARVCPEEIGQLGFLLERDDGRISPEPLPQECLLDYTGFMSFCEGLILTDWMQCTRRSTFEFVKFPDSRAYESPYLLDFTQKYKIHLVPEITGFVHLDSTNRISAAGAKPEAEKISRDAPDHLAAFDRLLARHGKALAIHGPRRYQLYRKMQLLAAFFAGKRWRGSRLGMGYLLSYPGDVSGWAITVAGLAGPQTLTKIRLMKQQLSNLAAKYSLRSKTTGGGA